MRIIAYNSFQLFFIQKNYEFFKYTKKYNLAINNLSDLVPSRVVCLKKLKIGYSLYHTKRPLRYFILFISMLVFNFCIGTHNILHSLDTFFYFFHFFYDYNFFSFL
jgi:hypothetical protein